MFPRSPPAGNWVAQNYGSRKHGMRTKRAEANGPDPLTVGSFVCYGYRVTCPEEYISSLGSVHLYGLCVKRSVHPRPRTILDGAHLFGYQDLIDLRRAARREGAQIAYE